MTCKHFLLIINKPPNELWYLSASFFGRVTQSAKFYFSTEHSFTEFRTICSKQTSNIALLEGESFVPWDFVFWVNVLQQQLEKNSNPFEYFYTGMFTGEILTCRIQWEFHMQCMCVPLQWFKWSNQLKATPCIIVHNNIGNLVLRIISWLHAHSIFTIQYNNWWW